MIKELILDGDGQATFQLKETGELAIKMFDQRTIVDTFTRAARLRLLWWLVRGFIGI